MKRASFNGFSGEVAFDQKTGDRNVDGAPYFFWNFAPNLDSEDVGAGFKKIGTFAQRMKDKEKGELNLKIPVVWPRGDVIPDDRLLCDPELDFISTVQACDPLTGTRTLTLRLKPGTYCRVAGVDSFHMANESEGTDG